ncbi:MAG: TIGR01212 family radical SAM protein [Candidatus Aminicenantes bacterium]|nr:TIGR01212 family radical SAM protein [Candidatus Aminicenantes bacterium]NIM80782.1 TIGR01212 family radical SAM protein [Candidatus Aminicenantes bacterium]NIN20164.1 TIGR01212 family radical SAM protein [Candidatus Aminicenantes bacterium]NIN43944.1 TIGR01212 family radical SAM protein [Candidatus Aminicenantes bacterium]NIN86753.1 TIGR01212 family radical SAM protein [Candidatus Aminicenantes bacterium]
MKELYNSFNSFLKKKFNNQKVKKIPINAGFPCPNKNGKISRKGCIFCDTYGSGPIKTFELPVAEQINRFIGNRKDFKYIAYYQAHTNTNAPVEELRKKYEIIFDFKEIVGLFIGTRPDSIADEVYPLLEELNGKTYLTVELGLQSIHAKSHELLNRNHTYSQFLETYEKLKNRHIDVVVHLIVGIPGESPADMLETIKEMNRLKPSGIKFHLMHVLKHTPLFDMYEKGEIKLMDKDEYVEVMIHLLEHLDPAIVIHRLTGERDKEIFHAPLWALNKHDVIHSIRSRMKELNSFQGKYFVNNSSQGE